MKNKAQQIDRLFQNSAEAIAVKELFFLLQEKGFAHK
jgi:hypothetical protein